jgi:prepilin-type N-terminal cleavage/methylation domain-containing protein
MKPSSRPHRQHGFTLLELTIALVLLGILATVGATMIANSYSAARIIDIQQDSNAAARYAMLRMVREIQEIQYNTSTGNVSLTTMSGNQVAFTKTGIGATPTTNVTLQYNSGTQTLSLTYPSGTSTLATQVSNLGFTYLDANAAVTATANAVRYVGITLTLSPAGAQGITLNNLVALRNV